MSPFEIGIIGGNGAMGRWFADFFRANGYTVRIADLGSGITVPELVKTCRVIIVSVPIGVTVQVIEEVGPLMAEDALLMDLTSLKTASMEAMLRHAPAEVVGIHPLFGPDVPAMTGQNMVICPGRGERWMAWIREISEANGARIVEATPEKHDAMMAVIQGLTHVNTILMGLSLQATGIEPVELERFSTPIFRAKTGMIEKVFDQNPRLYAEIITRSPGMEEMLQGYAADLARLSRLIANRDIDGLAALLENRSSVSGDMLRKPKGAGTYPG